MVRVTNDFMDPSFRACASADRGELRAKSLRAWRTTPLDSLDMTWNEITGSVSTKRVWRTTNISSARVHHFRSVPVLKVLPTMPVHCMAFRPSMRCGIPVWRRKATGSNSYNCPRGDRIDPRPLRLIDIVRSSSFAWLPHRFCSSIAALLSGAIDQQGA